MADLADVENAMVDAVVAAVYPDGVSAAPSINIPGCRVYRGWPVASKLDADLRAGVAHVSIYAQPRVERNTTRFSADWRLMTPAAPKITLAVVGNTVTIGGTMVAGDIAAIKIGARQAYAVAVQANSTPASVASALAALIDPDYPGVSTTGAVIMVPTGAVLVGTVGGRGTSWRELRRQRKGFQVTVWANSPAQRDLISPVVDKAFAQIELAGFLALADGSGGRLQYELTVENDAPSKEILFRRDLMYSVEYPTTDTRTDPSILTVVQNEKGGPSPPDAPIVTTVL